MHPVRDTAAKRKVQDDLFHIREAPVAKGGALNLLLMENKQCWLPPKKRTLLKDPGMG
jgi:hypothetical protein